jgi:hypothetical protein
MHTVGSLPVKGNRDEKKESNVFDNKIQTSNQ